MTDRLDTSSKVEGILTYLVDNVAMIKARILRGGLDADKGAEHNQRLIAKAKAAITQLLQEERREAQAEIIAIGRERLDNDDVYSLDAYIEDMEVYLERLTKEDSE